MNHGLVSNSLIFFPSLFVYLFPSDSFFFSHSSSFFSGSLKQNNFFSFLLSLFYKSLKNISRSRMYNECSSPSSARTTTRGTGGGHRLRSPICCLGVNAVVEPESMTGQRTPRSPYEWLKSTAQELELRDRCRRVKTRIKVTCRNNNCAYNCAHHQHHHQRHHSHSYPGDFSYDPLSYALNFEDDVRAADEDGSFPNFTARLPASPVTKSRSATVDLISF